MEKELLRSYFVNEHGLMLINKHDLGLICGDVHKFDTSHLVDDLDRERVVNENAQDHSILQTYKQRFAFWGTTHNFHIHYLGLENPFSDKNTSESKKLNLFIEDEYQILRCNKQIGAIDTFVDLFVGFILHVEWVVCLYRIDDDLLR